MAAVAMDWASTSTSTAAWVGMWTVMGTGVSEIGISVAVFS